MNANQPGGEPDVDPNSRSFGEQAGRLLASTANEQGAYANHAADVRVDSLDGNDYVVAPVIAVQESVLKSFYLPGDELAAAGASFNGTPLPVGHPMDGEEFVTANTPERIESGSVGFFFNAEVVDVDGTPTLVGETWVNAAKSARLANDADPVYGMPLAILASHLTGDSGDSDSADVPDSVADAVQSLPDASLPDSGAGENDTSGDDGLLLEVSTAYWFTPDPSPGEFEGNEYAAVQRNVRPDHLALLPTTQGECSVADGCGAPRTPAANDTGTGLPVMDGGYSTMTDGGAGSARESLANAADAIGRFAHNCVCGCGGACHGGAGGANADAESEDSEPMKPSELAELTGISLDVLEEMEDGDRQALADLASHADDETDTADDGDDNGDGSTDDDTNTNTNGGTSDDGVMEAIESLRDDFESVKADVAEAKELAAAQENQEREALIDRIEPNSSMTRDQLEAIDDTDVLEGMAADLAGPSADLSGRVSGVPGANGAFSRDDGNDERVEEASELAGQLSGRLAPDGSGEGGNGGDDE